MNNLAAHQDLLKMAIATAILLIVAFIVIYFIRRALRRALALYQTHHPIAESSPALIVRWVAIALWVVTFLLALNLWGVGVSGIWTSLVGALTLIGVGFLAVWAMVSNFTASVFITIWRPFQTGSSVELVPDGQKGEVVHRNMMFTVLREAEGSMLYIPNNLFFQKVFRVKEDPRQSLSGAAHEAKGGGRRTSASRLGPHE